MYRMAYATAIVVGVSTGFLNEMGKDLYQHLKKQLADLTTKTMKKPRIEPSVYGNSGKIDKNNPYSNAFSIYQILGREINLNC